MSNAHERRSIARRFRRASPLLASLGFLATSALGCSAAPPRDPEPSGEGPVAESAAAVTTQALLLVVTDDVLKPALRPLIAHKNATGMPAQLVTVKDLRALLYPCPGNCWTPPDDAWVVKAGIDYYYRKYGTRFVFLAGDETHAPVRYATGRSNPSAPPSINFSPNDLYYSDLYVQSALPTLKLSTWDANHDGHYNESEWGVPQDQFNPDQVDGNPDVRVGRLAVNDVRSMANYVSKVIQYETQTQLSATSALFLEDELYPTADTDSLKIASDFHSTGSKYYRTIEHTPGGPLSAPWSVLYDTPPSGQAPDLSSVPYWTASAGFMTYVGHGAQSTLGFNGGDWNGTFDGMTDANTPMMFASACQTGLFTAFVPDDHDNGFPLDAPPPPPQPIPGGFFANHVLAANPVGGAIAYAGESIIMQDDSGAELLDDVARCYSAGYPTLGDMWMCAQNTYWKANTRNDARIFLGIMTLFGDPSLRIQRGQGPIANPVTYPGASPWSSTACQPGETCKLADVNRDGKADVIAFTPQASWPTANVSLSNGTNGFLPRTQWSWFFCQNGEQCDVGDFDHDGNADVVAFTGGASPSVWVGYSNGVNGFGQAQQISTGFCSSGDVCRAADINGDGAADLVRFTQGPSAEVWVQYSPITRGATFLPPYQLATGFCRTGETCDLGDVNGDGLVDLIAFKRGSAPQVWVGVMTPVASGLLQATTQQWSSYFCLDGEVCTLADVNHDGDADLISFTHGPSPRVFVGFSTGASFAPAQIEDGFFCQSTESCAAGDVSGDGAADLVAFGQPSTWASVAPHVMR
jgi:hypothetical protein